jgi:hypothetical protein
MGSVKMTEVAQSLVGDVTPVLPKKSDILTIDGDTLVPFIVAIICKITGRYHVRCRMGEFGRRYSAAGQRGQTLWPGRGTWPCPVPTGRTTF